MGDVTIGDARLMLGDCLERMAEIPDGSVDMILCDLPYQVTACHWDSIIPFEPLWAQYRRVIKRNGAIVLTASQPFTSALVMSNPPMFKYSWVWRKSRPSGFAQAKNMPLKNYEDICVFSTGTTGHASQSKNRMTYNPQNVIYAPRITKNTKIRSPDESAFGKRPSHKDAYLQVFTNYPSQVLEFASVSGAVHPTQKPAPLMEYLIRTYTNPGETVLDNCFGSATTGVACANTGRRFVGVERDATYFQVGIDRLRRHADDTQLRDLWTPLSELLAELGEDGLWRLGLGLGGQRTFQLETV